MSKKKEIPTQIGRYKILSLLGKGGMGEVFLAQDGELKRQVAVKLIINPLTPLSKEKEIEDYKESIERFKREARLMADIRHPNVLQVFELGEHEGQPFIAMEFIKGDTLDGFLEKENPSQKERLILMIKILRAMEIVHSKEIIHRDLKPANILIHNDGEPVIMDFGLARGIGNCGMTQKNSVMGTPAYMPGEQFLRPLEITHSADIYALGVILYKMLSGRVPFYNANPMLLLRLVSEGRLPSLIEMVIGVDQNLEQICFKALGKTPEQRYSSCEEFANVLSKYVSPSKYQDWKQIGKGGIGTVYRVWNSELERYEALKVFSKEAVSGKEEAKALASLQHQNIVTIYEVGVLEDSGQAFIAMELLEGKSLKAVIKDAKTIHPKKAIEIIISLLEAAYCCHQKGLIHKDLKPSNVMSNGKGKFKIIDFSLVFLSESQKHSTVSQVIEIEGSAKSGDFKDFATYIAPEQLDRKNVGANSDQYALAAILYSMISGTSPFVGKSEEILNDLVKKGNVVPIEGINPILMKIIRKAMSKNPQERYVSCKAFAEDLLAFSRNKKTSVGKLTLWERLMAWSQVNKLASWIIGFSISLNCIFLIIIFFLLAK